MRYLYTADDHRLFAHAPGRRDFFKEGDDRVWAHESHGWLISANSGQALAHRTGDVYYGITDHEQLYRVSAEPESGADTADDGSDPDARNHSALRAGRYGPGTDAG